MEKINLDELENHLSNMLTYGKDLFVHSSLSSFGIFDCQPIEIINLIQKLIGPDATLIMSAATTEQFSKNKIFKMDLPPETGILSRTLLTMEGSHRSRVPMASVTAIGVRSKLYCVEYNSLLDTCSPFITLKKNDGDIMLFGVGYDKCTLYHLSEERIQSSYNFYKTFDGHFIDKDGQTSKICQTYFVRKDRTLKKTAGKTLSSFDKTDARVQKLHNGITRVFSANELDHYCDKLLSENPNAFCMSKYDSSI